MNDFPHDSRNKLDINQVPAAILAGGLATRLRPVTENIPKALVELAGRPFIDHQLELLKRNGIHRVVFCLGYLGEMVEQHLGDGSKLGMELCYSYDGPKLLGTGGAVRRAAHLLGNAFWVMYGDSYMDIDYAAVLEDFSRSRNVTGNDDGAAKRQPVGPQQRGVSRPATCCDMTSETQTPDMHYIDYGVALLRREAIASDSTGTSRLTWRRSITTWLPRGG